MNRNSNSNDKLKHLKHGSSLNDDWETLSSLEYVANSSFQIPQEQSPNTGSQITLHTSPELVVSTITYLIGKHRNLKTGANVTRVATKCGVLYLATWKELALLKIAGDQIYELGDERARLSISGVHLNLKSLSAKYP